MEWGEYMQSLNETKAGESYTIKWMTGMPETMEQIRQYDVSEGKTVQIISRIPVSYTHLDVYKRQYLDLRGGRRII